MVTAEQRKKVESYRWIIWIILALMYIFVTFHRMATGVVRADLQADFNADTAQFATIGSMYFYAYFVMQIPSGVLADSLGPKKTVTYFSVLAAVGSVIFGLAPNLPIAYLGRFLVGIGVSVVFVCLIKIQSRWFYAKNLAFMVGMVGLIANLGALLAQTPLLVVSGMVGWRNTFIALGILMVFFSILTLIFVKDDPTDMGLPGMDELEGRPLAGGTKLSVKESLKSVMRNKETWILGVAIVGMYVGYISMIGTYGVSFSMIKFGISKMDAANVMIMATIGSSLGGLGIGIISDKIRKRKIVLITAAVATFVGWLIFLYVPIPSALVYPFMLVFGFFMSGFTMTWTMSNECNDRRLSGIATGVVNCVGFAGTAVIPVFMGRVLDRVGESMQGYQSAFMLLIVTMAVSIIAILLSKETNASNIYESLQEKKRA